MQNNIWMPIADLTILTWKCIDGAERHGATIKLHHNSAEAIKADLHAMLSLNNDYLLGEAEIAEEYKSYAEKMAATRAWTTLTRDTLKRKLGNRPTEEWRAAGFNGSLVVPKLYVPLSRTIESLVATLETYPAMEVPGLDITAGKAKELYDALTQQNHRITNLKVMQADVLVARNKAVLALRHRLRNLINELKQLIDPHDVLWLDFGLNIPGEVPTPSAPQEVEVKQLSETVAQLAWQPVPHAKHYRVWKREEGKEEPVFVRRTREPRIHLEDLDPGKEVEFSISAVNKRGEGKRSAATKVKLVAKGEAVASSNGESALPNEAPEPAHVISQ